SRRNPVHRFRESAQVAREWTREYQRRRPAPVPVRGGQADRPRQGRTHFSELSALYPQDADRGAVGIRPVQRTCAAGTRLEETTPVSGSLAARLNLVGMPSLAAAVLTAALQFLQLGCP